MHRPLRRRHQGYEAVRLALNPVPEQPEGERPGCFGWASIAMTVVSALSSAAAASQKGQAESNAAMYQAAVARNNEIVAKQNADYAIEKGKAGEEAKRERTAQMIGSQRARAGASGLAVEGESGLRLYSDIAQLGEVDALTIRNNAAREAYGWETQGANFAAEAKLYDMRARSAEDAGSLGAFSSIIGGASGVADKWMKFKA